MFSTLINRMSLMSPPSAHPEPTRASSSDSIDSVLTVGETSNAQSSSSTPPTSIGDDVSVSSTSMKPDTMRETPISASSARSRRVRTSVGTYNVKVLSGTAIHAPRKFAKDRETGNETRRRSSSGDLLPTNPDSPSALDISRKAAGKYVREGLAELDLEWSILSSPPSKRRATLPATSYQSPSRSPPKNARKSLGKQNAGRPRSTRSTIEKVENPTRKLTASILGKRRFETGLEKAKRELRNLADTKEFAKLDTEPVVHEVWSRGKLVVPENPKKKRKLEEEAAQKEKEKLKAAEAKAAQKVTAPIPKRKTWLNKGLYAGQESEALDWFAQLPASEKKKIGDEHSTAAPNKFLPLPMWHGQRLLYKGRDFRLPWDVCSPLPPGQPKPDEWRKTSSNRFVGDAGAMWKKSNLFDSFSSKCVCTPAGGCGDNCQNRIMLYECDDTNCGAGRDQCTNRAFATLQERRKGGGKYRIGVEVIKTADRGYGVRSNRCFDANQIIVEYTGEIITEEECDRRMNEDYKNNECYYLMSFDQSMIIDATKGSIARFVNHSCRPNCKMEKWIVGGKPRMALFAGNGPIMTGDELTYDYNFDPFSAKNVQVCRCGSDNCRGVLGPKPKETKPLKDAVKAAVKSTVKTGKRKLKELLGGEKDANSDSVKRRKIKQATGSYKRASPATTAKSPKGSRIIKKSVITARRSVARRDRVMSTKTTKSRISKTPIKSAKKVSFPNSRLASVGQNISPRTGKPLRAYTKRSSFAKSVIRSVSGRSSQAKPSKVLEKAINVILGEDED